MKEAKQKKGVRDDIALYIERMHLDIKDLDKEFDFGVYAVSEIVHSDSFHGFVDGLRGKKRNPEHTMNKIDYKLGYTQGRDIYQYRRIK